MKSLSRLLVLLLLVLAACSVGRPPEDASGQEIYRQICSRCHGEGLAGGVGPSLGAGSEVAEMSDEFMRFTIHNGRGRMPSFSHTLSDEQVDRVVTFIREVQGR